MKHLVRLSVSAFLVFGLFGCSQSAAPDSTESPNSRAGSQSSDYFKTHFQDESQYIVETVLSDIAGMASYARNQKLPAASGFSVGAMEKPGSVSGAPVYQCQLARAENQAPITFELPVNRPIWSPDVYGKATHAIFDSLNLETGKSLANESEDVSVLDDLTDGRARTIEDLNRTLSAALQKDFRNPALHEKAALLLGAFVQRETSGKFYNVRAPLCRMTAHLAFARALRGDAPPSLSGRFAEILLDTGMGNQKDALAKIEKIKSNENAAMIWKRVLYALNTGDYRPLAEVPNTPVERAAWFWSYSSASSVTAAWGRLYEKDLARPEFCRMANSMDYSVSVGHDLLQRSLPLEQKEIEEIYELYHGKKLAGQDYASVLNDLPEGCVSRGPNGEDQVHVIGWGQWASFLQRQLCHAVQQNYYFLNNKWGVHDEAKAFAAEWDRKLSGLRLDPFVRRFTASDEASYHKAVDDGFAVTVETPHLVSPECWNYLCYKVSFAPLYSPNPNPHVNEWHKHNPPPGTAYDPSPRMNHPSLISQPDTTARMEKLHEIAPYDLVVSWNLRTAKYGTNATYEQLVEIYRPLLDYSATPMVNCAVAAKDEPDNYERLMLQASKLQAWHYGDLADYFWNRTNVDKAVYYAEQRVEHDPNSVGVANSSGWLIQHYLDVGNTNAARKLADFAGDVYSYRGLEAKAGFLERIENYDEAFEWYQKIEERYNDSWPLMYFCIRYRQKTDNRRFELELDKHLKDIFPKGMKKVSVTDFAEPPAYAVLIDQDNDLLKEAGLKKGDVVVAVDDIQVFTLFQYIYVRDKGASPDLKLIVWDGTKYRAVTAHPPNRRFKADFRDYNAKSSR